MSTTIKKRHREQNRQERQQKKDVRRANARPRNLARSIRMVRKTLTWPAWLPALKIPRLHSPAEYVLTQSQDKWLFQ